MSSQSPLTNSQFCTNLFGSIDVSAVQPFSHLGPLNAYTNHINSSSMRPASEASNAITKGTKHIATVQDGEITLISKPTDFGTPE